MPAHRSLLLAGFWLLAAAVVTPAGAADPLPSRLDADRLKQKIALMAEQSAAPGARPLRTTVTENEVNAYLKYEAQEDLPAGVVEPTIAFLDSGRVSGRASVDLDQIRDEHKPTSLFDPMRYLRGRLPVTARGVLTSGGGMATFELESAEIAGVPIPKRLLQQIVSYYSRSAAFPSGFSLDDPVALPARIREIALERGQAIVIQ